MRSHHERLDGSGYPDGLRGDQIPVLAQIVAICDVFDALTTDRPYREALSADRACGMLAANATRGLHAPDLVDRFIDLLEIRSLREHSRKTQLVVRLPAASRRHKRPVGIAAHRSDTATQNRW